MKYTKDNPKLLEYYYEDFEGKETFTGVVRDKYYDIAYYLNGKLHRENGPAVIYSKGTKKWFINGRYHRTDGPAIEWYDGTKVWYLNGKYHREDGPAVEYIGGSKYWYLNDEKCGEYDDFTNESWIRFVKLQLFN